MSIAIFPTPEYGGPQYKKFRDLDPSYDDITTEQKMDDGGTDYNLEADTPTLFWEIAYDVLPTNEAQILDDHRALAKGKTETFTLVHPRTGISYSGVRYLSYERDHDSRYLTTQIRKIVLVKYP